MAHTLSKVNLGNNAVVMVKITDYVFGGESFTLSELGLTGSLVNILFIADATAIIKPKLSSGKVLLLNPSATAFDNEVPTTVGLNYSFAAIVQGS